MYYGKVAPTYSYAEDIEHHGVKGMKWGVIRTKISATGRVLGSPLGKKNLPPSITQRDKYYEKAKAKGSGPKDTLAKKPPQQEEKQVNNVTTGSGGKISDRQRMKNIMKSDLAELNNDDLMFMRQRLQLEAEYKKATAPKPGVGAFLKEAMIKGAKETTQWLITENMKGAAKSAGLDALLVKKKKAVS